MEDTGDMNVGIRKNSPDCKVFVGGIGELDQNALSAHFANYGTVMNVLVKYDHETGRPRGFAFVEFSSPEECQRALAERNQVIEGKNVEVKPAVSRGNKKVFIGGIAGDLGEENLKSHFERFGNVETIEWPTDRNTGQKKNFAFVIMETEEGANAAVAEQKQVVGYRSCDVKLATPSRPSNRGGHNAGYGGGYGGYGGGGYGYGMPGGGGGYGGQSAYNNWYNQQQYSYAAAQQPYGGGNFGGSYPSHGQNQSQPSQVPSNSWSQSQEQQSWGTNVTQF